MRIEPLDKNGKKLSYELFSSGVKISKTEDGGTRSLTITEKNFDSYFEYLLMLPTKEEDNPPQDGEKEE